MLLLFNSSVSVLTAKFFTIKFFTIKFFTISTVIVKATAYKCILVVSLVLRAVVTKSSLRDFGSLPSAYLIVAVGAVEAIEAIEAIEVVVAERRSNVN